MLPRGPGRTQRGGTGPLPGGPALMYRLLIVDESEQARAGLRSLLPWRSYGFDTVAEADSYASAVDRALDIRPHAALVALRLGERSGVDLIEHLLAAGLQTAFCILSDSGDAASILRAMRAGARDWLLSPPDAGEVRAFLERALPGCTGGTNGEGPGRDLVPHVDPARLSPLANKILLMALGSMDTAPVTLTSIAEALHMNSKYLGQVFLRETGMKLSAYVTACRMERAGRLVTGTSEKISAIASMVGYSQPNRFYVHFKTYFGVSPGTMRALSARPEDAPSEETSHEVAFEL